METECDTFIEVGRTHTPKSWTNAVIEFPLKTELL